MILVDTKVILDLINDDPEWRTWSISQLAALGKSQELWINVMIYTKLLPAYSSEERLKRYLRASPFIRKPLPYSAGGPSARAFAEYRKKGGVKTAPLPDFFIGAHAEAEGLTILTRDAKRYRTYFPKVELICPS
jgi:predicted nucleic acid-binding protein